MIRRLIVLTLVACAGQACSSDKESDSEESESKEIVGTWDATELRTEDSAALFGKGILDHLTEKDCYVLTFSFKEDLSMVAESAVNELDINATASGLDIPCPEEKSSDSSTYTYDGNVLTIQDFNGKPLNAKVNIDGSLMEVDAEDVDIPNFDYNGQLIFRKR